MMLRSVRPVVSFATLGVSCPSEGRLAVVRVSCSSGELRQNRFQAIVRALGIGSARRAREERPAFVTACVDGVELARAVTRSGTGRVAS